MLKAAGVKVRLEKPDALGWLACFAGSRLQSVPGALGAGSQPVTVSIPP